MSHTGLTDHGFYERIEMIPRLIAPNSRIVDRIAYVFLQMLAVDGDDKRGGKFLHLYCRVAAAIALQEAIFAAVRCMMMSVRLTDPKGNLHSIVYVLFDENFSFTHEKSLVVVERHREFLMRRAEYAGR